MILYRPVGLQELALIYDSGMKAFPARLPQQPIFYPVLDLDYARQTASSWNASNGEFAGYVTQFKVEDEYLSKFEEHTVGESQYQELWVPAEEVEEFNKHIVGHIKVVEAHFGEAFQGLVAEKFGLQRKNAAEQFTVLTDFYLYKRMDFYLEIKRNHKAVFLNYPFWQKHEFKNPGLKEKVLQATKEAWLASFPQIPLPLPPAVQEDTPLVKQTRPRAQRFADPAIQEASTPEEQTDSYVLADAVEEIPFEEETDSIFLANPVEETRPVTETHSPVRRSIDPVEDDATPVEQTEPDAWMDAADEDRTPAEQTASPLPLSPIQEEMSPVSRTDSHFVRGVKLGLSGQYREAIGELFKAVEGHTDHVIAQTSLGVAFHRLGEDDRAVACYETALKIDPIYAEAHYFRANILYRRGNVREAITGYTIAIGLQPELIEAHQKAHPQDRLTDYTGSPAEMVRVAKPAHRILGLNKSLETNPGQANLWKERAAQYYRLRNYAQAIADYSSALTLQPKDASTLHLRGVAYEQLGQSDRAHEDYRQASALQPQLSDEYINRGLALGKTGNLRQAIASLTESIRLAPGNPDAYFNRGIMYSQQGDFKSAIADLSDVIRLSPRDEEAYYWRGIFNEEAGRQREAMADYRQFLMLSQDPRAKAEVEQKLRQQYAAKRDRPDSRRVRQGDRQKRDPAYSEPMDKDSDLYSLLVALGERALRSIWFGSGLNCHGEKAEELSALSDRDRPIEGRDFLSLAPGIRQTIEGDFQAFDPGADSPWIFIRAWQGSGFYIETNDLKIKERLKSHFPSLEDVDGATPPYHGLFIRV